MLGFLVMPKCSQTQLSVPESFLVMFRNQTPTLKYDFCPLSHFFGPRFFFNLFINQIGSTEGTQDLTNFFVLILILQMSSDGKVEDGQDIQGLCSGLAPLSHSLGSWLLTQHQWCFSRQIGYIMEGLGRMGGGDSDSDQGPDISACSPHISGRGLVSETETALSRIQQGPIPRVKEIV